MAQQPSPASDQATYAADEFIGVGELACRLELSPRTVRRMIERGELPKPCLGLGGRPRWLWGYVVEFCRKRHEREGSVDRKLRKKLK